MKNIKLIVEYDGTNYHGWQTQINAKTLQDTIQYAIKKLTGEEVNLVSSSRTDAGVHSYGMTCNFLTNSTIPPERFYLALNGILPKDIVIKFSKEVEKDFHSRYSSKAKRYRYLIYNSKVPSVFYYNKAYHIKKSLDYIKMQKAAQFFVGKHDFSAFRASGCTAKVLVKNILEVSLQRDGDIICFEIVGDGFLYNMVRIIVGTLIDVGLGKIQEEDILKIIKNCDRKNAGKTAPAHGLYLMNVYY